MSGKNWCFRQSNRKIPLFHFRCTSVENGIMKAEKRMEKYRVMDIFAEQQYIVERLDGDYAYLKNINLPEEELKCVARALLPEVSEGTRLRYEMMSYEVME